MKPLVRVRGVACRLGGVPVLKGVDLELADGAAIAVLGSSGSGKSTLLRIIAGLHVPERGEVAIGGQMATARGRLLVPPHRRGVAMLFQDLALWPNLTVAGNVRLGLSGLRLSRRQIRVATCPTYCSKHNPIERRFFPHVTRACEGLSFDCVWRSALWVAHGSKFSRLFADFGDESLVGLVAREGADEF